MKIQKDTVLRNSFNRFLSHCSVSKNRQRKAPVLWMYVGVWGLQDWHKYDLPDSTKHLNILTFKKKNIKSRQLWLMHLIDFNIVWILLECIDYCSAHFYWPCHSSAACCTLPDVIWKLSFLLFLVRTPLLKPLAVQNCSSSLAAVHMKYENVFFSPFFSYCQLLSFTVDSW